MERKDAGVAVRHVLLVEDDLLLGEMLVSALTRDRESITISWFVRARLEASSDGSSQNLVFMDADGKEFSFLNRCLAHQNIDEQLTNNHPVHLAFVDYRLKMSVLTGPEVTRKLTADGVKVIAISGLSSLNGEMIKAGAHSGMEKDKVFSRALKESDFLDQIYSL